MESIGLDIVDIARINKAVKRFGDKFVSRILSDREIEAMHQRLDKPQFIAGRFAAKEAVVKALGRFLQDRPSWRSLEILKDDTGQPYVVFPDEVLSKLEGKKCLVSISHEKNVAVAVAVIVEDK